MFTSIAVRGELFPASAGKFAVVALLLVYDKQPGGVLASVADVIFPANSEGFENVANRDRFQILYRKQWSVIGGQGTSGGGEPYTDKSMYNVDEKVVFKRVASFNGSTGLIGNLSFGALYAIVIGDTLTAVAPRFTVQYRLTFTDLG